MQRLMLTVTKAKRMWNVVILPTFSILYRDFHQGEDKYRKGTVFHLQLHTKN